MVACQASAGTLPVAHPVTHFRTLDNSGQERPLLREHCRELFLRAFCVSPEDPVRAGAVRQPVAAGCQHFCRKNSKDGIAEATSPSASMQDGVTVMTDLCRKWTGLFAKNCCGANCGGQRWFWRRALCCSCCFRFPGLAVRMPRLARQAGFCWGA